MRSHCNQKATAMFMRSIVVLGFIAILAGCPSRQPQISPAETTAIIEAWFRDEGAPEGHNTFDKAQEKCVKVVSAYSYGQASETYAEVELTDFRIRKHGIASSYNGKAKVHLRKPESGRWEVAAMSLLDGDRVKEFFYPKKSNPDGQVGPTPNPATSTPAASPSPPPATPASSPKSS